MLAPAGGHTLAGAQPDSAVTQPSGPRPPCPEDSAEAAKPCPLGDSGWGPRLPLWSAPGEQFFLRSGLPAFRAELSLSRVGQTLGSG